MGQLPSPVTTPSVHRQLLGRVKYQAQQLKILLTLLGELRILGF